MNFENKLISGLFLKRYKRFFVDIKINNQIVTAHCPNTGSMHGLLEKGNKVWLSKSNNPKRKLKYTLEIIEAQKSKVGVNTLSANKIIYQSLKNKLIKEFKNILEIKPETKFGAKRGLRQNKNGGIFHASALSSRLALSGTVQVLRT